MVFNKMGFQDGYIFLNEPKCVYFSGQIIFGTLNFDLIDSANVLSLDIVHLGEANVKWTKENLDVYSGISIKNEIIYKGHENIFNYVHCIIGNNGSTVLPSGPHSIPFAYQIPFYAPSSFHHDYGHIRYSVNAYLTHVDGTKEELTKEYSVIAPIDLNLKENAKEPAVMVFEQTHSSSWVCKSRQIAIRVTTPQSGYCPGELIPITIEALENSNINVSQIKLMFAIKEHYHSHIPKSTYSPPEEILVSKKICCKLDKTNPTCTTFLKIPEMIAPNLENCNIIDIKYFLKAKIHFSMWYKPVEHECEISIGLVPLNKNYDATYHPLCDSLPVGALPNNNISDKEYSNVAIYFNPDTNFFKSKKPYPSSVASNPKLKSIAEIVEENRFNRSIDLYTSYELGYKSDVPESVLPVTKPTFTSDDVRKLPENEDLNCMMFSDPTTSFRYFISHT